MARLPTLQAYNYIGGSVISFRNWSYNAAGRMTQVKETVTATSAVSTIVTNYDGDGEAVRVYEPANIVNSDSYMVRSSVFGGTVTRLNNAGNKVKTTVNVDDRLIAMQYHAAPDYMIWTHTDPLGLSEAGDTKSVTTPWVTSSIGSQPQLVLRRVHIHDRRRALADWVHYLVRRKTRVVSLMICRSRVRS